MTNLTRYTAADLSTLMDKITKNSIGMDEYFDRLFNLHETTKNYPPYNLIQVNNVESHLEIALAGFKKERSMSSRSMENFLSKGNGRTPNPRRRLSTRDWLKEVFNERGLYPTTQKYGKSPLKTDSSESSSEK